MKLVIGYKNVKKEIALVILTMVKRKWQCKKKIRKSLRERVLRRRVVLRWKNDQKPAEQRFLRAVARNHPILTPTQRNWQESGKILGNI